jgi:hypothetical protein
VAAPIHTLASVPHTRLPTPQPPCGWILYGCVDPGLASFLGSTLV